MKSKILKFFEISEKTIIFAAPLLGTLKYAFFASVFKHFFSGLMSGPYCVTLLCFSIISFKHFRLILTFLLTQKVIPTFTGLLVTDKRVGVLFIGGGALVPRGAFRDGQLQPRCEQPS